MNRWTYRKIVIIVSRVRVIIVSIVQGMIIEVDDKR